MFYESARRYRFRRFAVLRSMPLSSAPNSCAVISRRCSAPSPNGTAYVPSSSRLLQTAKPSRSQYRIFTRSLRRLVNTNRCPAKASSSRCSRTSACRLSKPLRISHGVRQRYTRTLAGKWIMPAKHPALSATYRGVHAAANTQPRAGCQHQLQYRFGRAILPSRAPFHQSEPHRPSFLKPFTPTVKGPLRQPLFPAELLDGHPAAPLRRDSFGPLVCFRVERLRLNDSIAHDTTMHRRPVRQKERFTRRLRDFRAWPKTLPDFAFGKACLAAISGCHSSLAGVDPFWPGRIHPTTRRPVWRAGPASRDSSKASTLKDPLRVHARAAVAR